MPGIDGGALRKPGIWRTMIDEVEASPALQFLSGMMELLVGTLVLGVGLPLLVVGMALEITGFLTWIALRQRVPRGLRVPGVGSLFAEADKRRAFAVHVIADLLLVMAALAPVVRIRALTCPSAPTMR